MSSSGVLNSATPLKTGIQTLKSFTGTEELFSSSPAGSRLNQSYGPGGAVNPTSTNILSQVDYYLNGPTIRMKCNDLTYILEHCPQRELAAVYQKILDKVFDIRNGGRGFNVGYVWRSREPEDFRALHNFLGCTGPMLRTSTKLLSDPYLRFDFPISLLSSFTQHQIETMTATQFIASKLSPHNASNLLLNSFEYYMFTFATYLVKPYTLDNKIQTGESLYTTLAEEYLAYFLPCDGTTPPLLPSSVNINSSPPSSPSSLLERTSATSSTSSPQTPGRKSLLRNTCSSFLSSPSSTKSALPTYSSPEPSSQHQLPGGGASGQQVYRSESMIYTFFELWLSPFCQATKTRSDSPLSQKSVDILIPVSDTLRIIRMLIKHMHFFVNSGGPLDVSHLCQLKRTILPNVKARVYSLFKFIFMHWPHDMSFRLVLETWLSYIQPWRYTDAAASNRFADEATNNVDVDSKWQQFVAENILFYTHTLRLLLPRFFRMDLTASKNALMLFRIAKIFSQKGLKQLIRNAEGGLERLGAVTTGFGHLDYLDGMPSMLNMSEVSESVISASRQCVIELEGTAFKYEPIFGNLFRQTVSDILCLAARAHAVAEDTIAESTRSTPAPETGSWEWITSTLLGTGKPVQDSPEVEDFKKSINYLNQALNSLSTFFDLRVPESPSRRTKGRSESGSLLNANTPETVSDHGSGCRVLTPHGRWQVLQGVAKPECRYEGDPDLLPIGESELVWLVRGLYQLASRLNTKYGHKMEAVYQEDSVPGEMARMVLAEPCRYYTVQKRIDGGPPSRQYQTHKPRLSLRFMGSWKFLVYLTFSMFLVSLLFRTSFLGSLPVLAVILFVLLAVTGTVRHIFSKTKTKYVVDLDISLDHSKMD